MELKYVVNDEFNIRQVLREKLGISIRLLTKLKKNKKIFLNNSSDIYLDMKVKNNDIIKVLLDFDEDNTNIIPCKMDLDILYEDEYLIILNKPYNMPVHPSLNHYEDSLSNGLKYYFDKINLKRKIRPINRLDKDTSGIVMFAKNEYVQDKIKINKKIYFAVVSGTLKGSDIISKPISRKKDSIIERCINENGEKALTEYCVIKNFNIDNIDLSLVKCIIHTGRTHQIRVHMASTGHPILGDTLYATSSKYINRQALHAFRISFIHPILKKEIEVTSPIPDDIKNLYKKYLSNYKCF